MNKKEQKKNKVEIEKDRIGNAMKFQLENGKKSLFNLEV